jgi:serine phosphatase RsbU (regulator of sigma subunit)
MQLKRIKVFKWAIACIVILIVNLINSEAYAEQGKYDSLLNIITTSKQDTSIAMACIDLSSITNNIDSIRLLSLKCLTIVDNKLPKSNAAVKRSLLISKALAYNNMCYVVGQNGDVQGEIDYCLKAIAIHKQTGFKIGLATSYNNLAFIYQNQGQIEKSLSFNLLTLQMMEELGDKVGIARALNNLGSIYESQHDTLKAIESYKRSLKIRQSNNDQRGIGISFINLGSIYADMKLNDTAIYYYHRSAYQFKMVKDEMALASSYNNLGNFYMKNTLNDSALFYFNASLALRRKNNIKDGIAYSLNNLGSLYYAKNNLPLAEKYANESYKLAKELGYPKLIINATKLLNDIYKKQGRYKEALGMHEIFTHMKDSMNNEDTKKAAYKTQLQYDFDKKAIADSLKTVQEKAVINVKLEKEQAQKKYLYAIILLALLSAIFIFNRYKITNQQKKIIEHQKSLVDAKQKELLDSITYSKTIQNVFLPKTKLVKSYLENSFILYLPKDIVAGDFYWMEVPNERKNLGLSELYAQGDNLSIIDQQIYIAVCDCTGHGVPGAMVSVVCNNALNSSLKEFGKRIPGEIFDKTRELIIENFGRNEEDLKDGMDASLASINLKHRTIFWSGANSPLWIISKSKPHTKENVLNDYGGIWVIKPDKQPIGKGYENKPYTTHAITLNEGDLIYMFTDGYADQFGGEKGKKLTKAKLRDFLLTISNLSMDEQRTALFNYHMQYKGNEEQVDDICVIGVRV